MATPCARIERMEASGRSYGFRDLRMDAGVHLDRICQLCDHRNGIAGMMQTWEFSKLWRQGSVRHT